MAGQQGKSGGARPGAGRKPKSDEEKLTIASNGNQTPLEFLLSVMNDNAVEDRLRLEAAKTAAQYVHPKVGETGKKEQTGKKAEEASKGRFSPSAPPLRIVGK